MCVRCAMCMSENDRIKSKQCQWNIYLWWRENQRPKSIPARHGYLSIDRPAYLHLLSLIFTLFSFLSFSSFSSASAPAVAIAVGIWMRCISAYCSFHLNLARSFHSFRHFLCIHRFSFSLLPLVNWALAIGYFFPSFWSKKVFIQTDSS